MCELENTVIPRLHDVISNWTRYVDDTFALIEAKNVGMVENELNNFHETIKFTHELEQGCQISFFGCPYQEKRERGNRDKRLSEANKY